MMALKTFLISTFLIAVQAAAEPAPYKLGSMSLNTAFGLLKRQSGYQPTQTICGLGSTCVESCGASFVQCASTDGDLHCFEPSLQQTCCPDGSGNSCDQGYYCTSDASGGTWCCPDGLGLAACAAAYSLTGSLVSETATATLSLPPSSTPAAISASLSSAGSTSSSSPTSTKSSSESKTTGASTSTRSSTSVAQFTATVNGSVATSTSSFVPVQVTAGANAKIVPGLLLVAGALVAM